MSLRDRRVLLASAALASVFVMVAGVAGHEALVAYAAPLLVLVLPLLAGRYWGEERIAQLSGRLRRRERRPSMALQPPVSRRHPVFAARGGRLIATGLAKRPPPVLGLS